MSVCPAQSHPAEAWRAKEHSSGGSSRFAPARLNADGSLGTGFDGDGRVITDFTPGVAGHARDA
ncbi:hypothetical protein [Streptomyces sp. NPDC046870]|uniref:hypothetical protein n=1 Tax=Streptomyces sp. NPDC046870 TaxID=3155135 RepID=UPI0034561B68